MTKETLFPPDTHVDFGPCRLNCHHHVLDGLDCWVVNFCVKEDEELYELYAFSQKDLTTTFLDWLADIAVRSPQHEHMCNQVVYQLNDLLPQTIINQICSNPPFKDSCALP